MSIVIIWTLVSGNCFQSIKVDKSRGYKNLFYTISKKKSYRKIVYQMVFSPFLHKEPSLEVVVSNLGYDISSFRAKN